MPSLVPAKALELPAMPDLPTVFKNIATLQTVTRVIDFLLPLYEEYSEISVEKAWSTTEISEELYIQMPTTAAYCAEIELCNAIMEHAAGQMSDAVMQLVLKNFLDTHIWIYYPKGPRGNKKGRWPDWPRGVQLYWLRYTRTLSGLEKKQEHVVNGMQAWLIRLLEERRGSTGFSLHRI